MAYEEILSRLKAAADPTSLAGMARYGIRPEKAYGISIPKLRAIAKEAGRDHSLAEELWASGIHEARILASMIADPKLITEAQLEGWVKDFDSWDLCDQCCINLIRKTKFAHLKALEWCNREEEFVKRAGLVLMAVLAVHDKQASDEVFNRFLPLIKRKASDPRNFVKKAANWALRQIGKRNANLQREAIKMAEEILLLDDPTAKWIAREALKELSSRKIGT